MSAAAVLNANILQALFPYLRMALCYVSLDRGWSSVMQAIQPDFYILGVSIKGVRNYFDCDHYSHLNLD